jgi:hypothetical protein
MTPEWEDIEPWQDERWEIIASGFVSRKIRPEDLDKLWTDLQEYLNEHEPLE